MKRYLLIIPVLVLIICSIPCFISCADDEALLETDSTFIKELPVDNHILQGMASSTYLANRYLKITSQENRMFFIADSLELMKLSPVILPEGESFKPGNYNFGWPVASMIDSTIVVSTQRRLVNGQVDDKTGKGQLLIISRDAGKNWETPVEVQNLQPYGYNVGSQSCIGTYDGKFIQKGNGILISDDLGHSWDPYPRAFKFSKREQYSINGPSINVHPDFGLIFFTGTSNTIDSGSVFRSDDGTIWEDSYWSVEDGQDISCPGPSVLIFDDGSILMISASGKNMLQYFYKYSAGDTYSDIRFSVDTIDAISTSTSAFDVPDLIYNPVSGNIEMLESNSFSLQLWSIGKDEILSGSVNWSLECVPFRRNGILPMYPAGSVVDLSNNLQHIFIYAGGEYPDRNCIYSISRSLDTKKLSEWVNNYRSKEGI